MQHNDIAKLVTLTTSGSEISRTETEIFCGKKSVTYKEFYAAVEIGINPLYVFEMDTDEYARAVISLADKKQRPTELIYDGEKFNIIRTYEPGDGTIQITVGL